MSYYEKELAALRRANRFRSREVVDDNVRDFASNDYLGLSSLPLLHEQTCTTLAKQKVQSPKASMLVQGYHQIHKDFEDALCIANGFEAGVVMGSGFNANIALIESLVRKGDTLFLDELYHASGVLASQIGDMNVQTFPHNDMQALQSLLENSSAKRKIIAVEGIYSMDGDLCDEEVFTLADDFDALLIVDEAHSSGVVGEALTGVFNHYNIAPRANHIKMGTLGKAYGSFGAYILASKHIVTYLLNRAKPLIYATSLSLYDTLRAHNALQYIQENTTTLRHEIKKRQNIVQKELDIHVDGLIVPLVVGDNEQVMQIKEKILVGGDAIGAIRQPTVPRAIVRLIARLGESDTDLQKLCKTLAILM